MEFGDLVSKKISVRDSSRLEILDIVELEWEYCKNE